jgi:glycolate oxidase FAD binding subunit
MPDDSRGLQARVRQAIDERRSLCFLGGGTKSFYGREPRGQLLETLSHSGIISYEPTELVLTARCGTPLNVIEGTLANEGQFLGFEPPGFGGNATLGGAIATGLSGPRRPFAGAARDFVLGCRIINGRGQILSFGGQVMKNVAGYDLSRLMAGSLGTLGLILDVSLKVLPSPEAEMTLRQEMPAEKGIAQMNEWLGEPLPISGLTWCEGAVYVRLSGGRLAVDAALAKLGGERLPADDGFWPNLRNQKLPFFDQPGNLWRFSLEPAAAVLDIQGEWLYEWGGGQRWLMSEDAGKFVFRIAEQHGGHATLFRSIGQRKTVFHPLPKETGRVQQRLKCSFDPWGLFNPGRMYREW